MGNIVLKNKFELATTFSVLHPQVFPSPQLQFSVITTPKNEPNRKFSNASLLSLLLTNMVSFEMFLKTTNVNINYTLL